MTQPTGARVLVVDDEPGIVRAVQTNLGRHDFRVDTATGVQAAPRDSSPGSQRNFLRTSLEKFGPNEWRPYAAPQLDVKDAAGKRVSLEEYRGRNVILVFYLGAECPHCMRQLHDIGEKKTDWDRLDTAVLAVSSASSSKNAATLKTLGDLPIRLLSDESYVNARRFHSAGRFTSNSRSGDPV